MQHKISWECKYMGQFLHELPNEVLRQLVLDKENRYKDAPLYEAAVKLCQERGIRLIANEKDKESRKQIVEEFAGMLREIYHSHAKRCHPDKNPGDKSAAAASVAVNNFYEAVKKALETFAE